MSARRRAGAARGGRTETDSLGQKRVPANAYYGIQTQRAVENYPISGIRAHPSLIRSIGLIKQAAALANRQLGLLDARRAAAIVRAASEVAAGDHNAEFVVDVYQAGAGVSFHMNANEVIANRALELLAKRRGEYSFLHPNDHVNLGQSTNDVYPTALRLAAIVLLDELVAEMRPLGRAFAAKAREFDRVLKAGRTHLQDATPIRLGQEFAAYGVAVMRAEAEIRHAQDGLRELGLGGTAVGTGLNSDPRYQKIVVRRLSTLSAQQLTPTRDLRWTMQSNLPLAVASSGLRNYGLELIRISNDLRLLSSGPNTGLAEITLPALQPGSSIMPGKVNPVIPEMVAMVGFQAVGNDVAVALSVQAGQLELNVMMPSMAWNVLHSAEILKNATRQFHSVCVSGIRANSEQCRRGAEATVGLAAALNPYIGYARAAEVAKRAVASGRTIVEVAEEAGALTPEELRTILDPRKLTEPSSRTIRPGRKAPPSRTRRRKISS